MEPKQIFLGLNPESTLIREIQGVMDELRTMIDVFTQQSEVVVGFQKCLKRLDMRNTPSLHAPTMKQAEFAEDLLQKIEERKAELLSLQDSAAKVFQDVSLHILISYSFIFLV